MIYGIEHSTDMRSRRTQIRKFETLTAARRWVENQPKRFTHDNPYLEQNYHHTLRTLYEFEGRVDKKDPIFKQGDTMRHSVYRPSFNDMLAQYIHQYGREIPCS